MTPLEALFREARDHYEAGRLEQAEAGYRRVLEAAPGQPHALHLLGVVAHGRGDPERAVALIGEACRAAPDNAEFARNLGIALAAAGRHEEAADRFQRALALEPGDPRLRLQLASARHLAGDPRRALEHYLLARERLPELAELHNQIGVCRLQLDLPDAAREDFARCLALEPEHGDARENLGRALLRQHRFAEAGAGLRALLAEQPGREEAWRLLGFAHLHQGDLEAASRAFLPPGRARLGPGGPGGAPPADPDTVTRTKLVHDIAQLEHLLTHDLLPRESGEAVLRVHRQALDALPAETPRRFFFDAPPVAGFRDAFNRLHLDWEAPRVRAGAVNPALDTDALQSALRRDGWAVVDDFLTAQALSGLQRFCTEPTVWVEKKFRREVGASLRNGFCCPLLLQIARDLRAALPDLYGRHLFAGCFAYKYFQSDRAGHLHADRGAVSLNLWITADEANLDPARSGLIIWNRRVPPEYFREQPEEIDRIHQRLVNEPDARASTIAYRCNRAVLFPSDVLHGTDVTRFREGYENRRVSVTFLFGRPGD